MFDGGGADAGPTGGWGHVASCDGAPAVIGAALDLDPDSHCTKTELSEAAGVPLKTLYLDGTLDELVAIGLLEKFHAEGEEVRFAVVTDSDVYGAAAVFESAVDSYLDTAGGTPAPLCSPEATGEPPRS